MTGVPSTPSHGVSAWEIWKAFGRRNGRIAALMVFACGALVHAVATAVFSTAYPAEIEALLDELYVFQCVPPESALALGPAGRGDPGRPAPVAERLPALDLTSVRVVFIERAVDRLGPERTGAALAVADVLRYDADLNARAGAVLALARMGRAAAPALPVLLDTLGDPGEDIRLRRLILDRLAGIAAEPEAVAPVLAALLDGEGDAALRAKAAKALTEITRRALR